MPLTVLIVEDEPLIRFDAANIARDAGFDVVQAANADEAIKILESRSDIRIVFTDIQMPGSMDGVKLANAVRGRWPPIALIVTSGHMTPNSDELPAGVPFITKPYRPEQLTALLRQQAA